MYAGPTLEYLAKKTVDAVLLAPDRIALNEVGGVKAWARTIRNVGKGHFVSHEGHPVIPFPEERTQSARVLPFNVEQVQARDNGYLLTGKLKVRETGQEIGEVELLIDTPPTAEEYQWTTI